MSRVNVSWIRIGIIVCVLLLIAFHYFNNSNSSDSMSKIANEIIYYPTREPKIYMDTALEMVQNRIKLETWNYNYTCSEVDNLEDLVMKSGGKPLKSIVLSTWRSGSSFLGDLLNSMPASFYSYEPLMMFHMYKQIRGPPLANRATAMLKNIMKCDYNNSTDLLKYFFYNKKETNVLKFNRRFWDVCSLKEADLCYNSEFMSRVCKLHPFQTLKLERLRLSAIQDLLNDKELNVRAVLLVRDPRAVMHSRRNIKNFCSTKNVPDCADSYLLCRDMVDDYKEAVNILQQHPDRLTVQRFEDLALNLKQVAVKLLKFLKLEPTTSVYEFLKTHTNDSSNSRPYSTFRMTRDIPFKWKDAMKYDDIIEIQDKCREAMSLWGYNLAHNASHLRSKLFNPLSLYSMPLPPVHTNKNNIE